MSTTDGSGSSLALDERTRLLLGNSLDVVIQYDPDGTVVWASPSLRTTFGWDPATITGTQFRLSPDADRARVEAPIIQARDEGRDVGVVRMRARCLDGTERWVDVTSRLLRDPEGSVEGALATMRDVTEQVEAEAALAESERRYRMVAENASDVVLRVAADDTFTWVSPSARTTFGWDPAQVVGRSGGEFVHPDDLARMRYERTLAHAGPSDYELYRIRHADGGYRWASARSTPVTDEQGRPDGRVVAIRDVTEQHEELERFRSSVDALVEPFAVLSAVRDEDGEIVDLRFDYVNRVLCDIYHQSLDQISGATFFELNPVRSQPELFEWFVEVITTGVPRRGELTYDEGFVGSFDFNIVKLGDGVVATAHDVTERREAERERFENAELLRIVLDNSRDATTRFAPDLRVEYVNRRVVELSGLGEDRWIGHTLDELGFPSDAVEAWSNHVRRVFRTGQPEVFEYDIETTVGHLWAEASLAPEFGPDGRVAHVVSTDRDVTDRKRAEDELRQLATHDPLTGLANRSALLEEITRSLHAARRSDRVVAALMLDLDHFKYVNDSLGHSVGDELIRAAAERILHGVRAGDFVARPGGDEFVVVMRDLDDPTEAVRTAQRLLHDFRGPFSVHDAELFTTASIGIAVSGRSGDADDLLREADTALYVAKDDGRDRLSLFNEELRASVSARLAIESDLRHALARDELAVWYQPEIDLRTGAVVAVEALLRWHHPSGELYTADSFIEVAEETGLILDIGDWVLRTAFAQAAAWARSAPEQPLTVRINLSAIQLSEIGLLAAVDDALLASGASPAGVCVEITETSLLRGSSTVRSNLTGLRERGIRVAVDDFGTGYASLAYLRDYPVDVLKVDRSFVRSITTRTDDQRLVAGIVSLAHSLDMSVTAEGVEQWAQATLLRELGCAGAQGFLYSRAVPADELDALRTRTFLEP